jgi:RNA polymerase sigma-70 factor (ECF subfamily)
LGVGKLATRNELSEFLASVERRAYKQGLYAVRDEHSALDIVQDAMMKLAEKYGDRPVTEFPMLFQRILQNTIRDYYRRQKVRSTWTTLMSSLTPANDDGDYDPLESLQDEDNNSQSARPDASLEQSQLLEIIETELYKLPIGRTWIPLQQPQQWDVPKEALKHIALEQHTHSPQH